MNPQHPDLESDALPLELLVCSLNTEKNIQYLPANLPCFFMQSMFSTEPAIFFKFHFVRCSPLILCRCIISSFAFVTCKRNNCSHSFNCLMSGLLCSVFYFSIPAKQICFHLYFFHRNFYAMISLTTPAPTVLPPSLIANRTSFSIAIGVISSTATFTLSPGITISVPSGRVTTPVTSVVLK